jgi:predicted RNA-binding Zn-ribbon protein involved in translation (DUF1610 family)
LAPKVLQKLCQAKGSWMPIEEINLACPHCGTIAIKELSWVQVNRHFRCDRCGRVSAIDKDRLCIALADQETDIRHMTRSRIADRRMWVD